MTISMPFITGPTPVSPVATKLSSPKEGLVAVFPLSKVQEVLWLDYVRRPWATHYVLTLKVDLSQSKPTLENIVNKIQQLGAKNDMLRATFHMDDSANDFSQSYMAIHDPSTSFQNVDIVSDEAKLQLALRSSFDLSTEFPVKWIVHQQMSYANGTLQTAYTVYAMGHHIAVDGSSMSHLSHEILQLANDEEVSTEVTTSPSYGEFVNWQNAYLRSTAAKDARNFWLSQVSSTSAYDWNHAAHSQVASGTDYRQMNTWGFFPNEELMAWSKLYGTSWFRIATSAIGLVVAGHSKPSPHHDHVLQVAFGARQPKFAKCISHMANTMPIRVPVSDIMNGKGEFGDLVKNVGKRISQAKKHEMFPFMSLLEASRQEGEANVSDKVVVTFSPKLADGRCTLYPVQGVWDLFFCFLEHDDGVSLGVITDPTVFDTAAVEKLKADFFSTVRMSQETASFQLDSLSYINSSVATLANGPDVDDSESVIVSRVADWFHQRAIAQPHALALYSAEQEKSMTYQELDAESTRRALYLQQQGLGPNDAVVLYIERSFELVVWILSVLKAGSCYVVLDQSLPLARKQAILRVAESKLFVTDYIDNAFFDECATKPEIFNTWNKTEFPVGQLQPIANAQPTDLAYIVFTSGSTGTPKAIMVEHQNLNSYVSSTRNVVKIGQGSRVLQFATFAFDASILEWAVTLAYGATMCFVNHPSLLVGDYLADMIDLNKINFFHTTPSVLSTLPDDRRLPSLKVLSVGGEASSAGLLDKWSKRLSLIHAYGPTETTVICANEKIVPVCGKLPSPSNIGLGNPNMHILICPEDSTDALPATEVGEICIAGPQVTRGYKGQPELTAEKFVSVQIAGKQTRLYRSGDRGYLDAEGKLNILGRMNNREIKLRGYRIDLAAVEKSILDYSPEVMMASVQVSGDRLVAYVVPESVQGSLIKERISADLPTYSVPAEFISLKELPLNANGKVDHKQVEAQLNAQQTETQTVEEIAQAVIETPAVAAQATGESVIAYLEGFISSLWQDVLGCKDAPAVDTSFYDAGGHSILLSALHKKIIMQYPESGFSLLDVFYNPTIRRQAAHLAGLVADSLPVSSATSEGASPFSTPGSGSSRSSIMNVSTSHDKLFAIVGMAGRFPGADSVGEMWDLLMEQRDGVSTYNGSGAADAKLAEGELFVPRYGAINGLANFKASDWNMSEEEANNLDPQKRYFLMTASDALADASIKTSKTEGTNVGTFVGIAHNTYQDSKPVTAESDSFESRYRVVLDPNASTLTAFKLNLTGPSIDINTACASSLVAMHQAINCLQAGDCEAALVGGVSVSYPQYGGYATAEGKIFSSTGECKPLDSQSNGSVPADGVAAIVIKPLTAAREAGDRIYAVIEGHAIGTDGAVDKIGFTVPSSTGQTKVVSEAIMASGVDPQAIKYVEMHGSGTSIGDALEFQGLQKAFAQSTDGFAARSKSSSKSSSKRATPAASGRSSAVASRSASRSRAGTDGQKVFVGSNKGNFGNSEAASGLTSLIKATLAVNKGVIPPMRQLGEVNDLVNLEKSRIQPLRSHLKLSVGDRVGVTALGYGGVNAHCIVTNVDSVM